MKKSQEPQVDLEDEYLRILKNEMIYFDEIALSDKLERFTLYLAFFSFVPIIVPLFFLPQNKLQNISFFELFPDYPLQISIVLVGFILIVVSLIANQLLSDKISKIRGELGLHREERLYLRAYETKKNIDSLLNEPNAKRKPYFKKSVFEVAQEMTKNVERLKYGNIRLITNLIGDQIDLLKDNMKRLVLSNIAMGDETVLREISEILVQLCNYILSPSVEKLNGLNNAMKELPHVEYEVPTRKQRIRNYFLNRPRFSRVLFASSITTIVVVTGLYLKLSMGILFAAAIASFWGAFAECDKIFRLKEN